MALPFRSRRSGRRPLYAAATVALTALTFVALPQLPASAGNGIAPGGVYVPDNAAVREDNSFSVYQVVNGGILPLVNLEEFTALGYNTATIAVVPPGTLAGVPQVPGDGTLVHERTSYAVYLIDNGMRFWIENPTVLAGLGYSAGEIRAVANGSLAGVQRGADIGEDDLPGRAIDPGDATASSYHHKSTDTISVQSANGKAGAVGDVRWYYGGFPFGFRHRGEYTNSPIVAATEPVGCIWAQIKWGFPTGSVSFPPGGANVTGGQEVGEYFVSCRPAGHSYPPILRLAGLSYAKALLNSTTLTVCTSSTKEAGPRWCGTQKMTY